jgi:hypothetical protein
VGGNSWKRHSTMLQPSAKGPSIGVSDGRNVDVFKAAVYCDSDTARHRRSRRSASANRQTELVQRLGCRGRFRSGMDEPCTGALKRMTRSLSRSCHSIVLCIVRVKRISFGSEIQFKQNDFAIYFMTTGFQPRPPLVILEFQLWGRGQEAGTEVRHGADALLGLRVRATW